MTTTAEPADVLTEVDSMISDLTGRLRATRREHVLALLALSDRARNAANLVEEAPLGVDDGTGDGLHVAVARVVSAAGLETETRARLETLYGVKRQELAERGRVS